MSDKYRTEFERFKHGSMDDLGFHRCPVENCIICSAETIETCKKCVVYIDAKTEDEQY